MNGFIAFKNRINLKILKKLKYSAKISPICYCKIDINSNIYNYLKTQFHINGRFNHNINFNKSFDLKQKRFFNRRNYCDYSISTFHVKISKRRAFSYYEEDMTKVTIKQDFVFNCRFIRRNNVISNSN